VAQGDRRVAPPSPAACILEIWDEDAGTPSTVKRTGLWIAATIVATLTWSVHSASRIHIDSLQSERRVTFRILGIPLCWYTTKESDLYPGVYTAITGKKPVRKRWLQFSSDEITCVTGRRFICGRSSLYERFQLTGVVYRQFQADRSRESASARLRRIDELFPIEGRRRPDFQLVDDLRADLGLKRYWPQKTGSLIEVPAK